MDNKLSPYLESTLSMELLLAILFCPIKGINLNHLSTSSFILWHISLRADVEKMQALTEWLKHKNGPAMKVRTTMKETTWYRNKIYQAQQEKWKSAKCSWNLGKVSTPYWKRNGKCVLKLHFFGHWEDFEFVMSFLLTWRDNSN